MQINMRPLSTGLDALRVRTHLSTTRSLTDFAPDTAHDRRNIFIFQAYEMRAANEWVLTLAGWAFHARQQLGPTAQQGKHSAP